MYMILAFLPKPSCYSLPLASLILPTRSPNYIRRPRNLVGNFSAYEYAEG